MVDNKKLQDIQKLPNITQFSTGYSSFPFYKNKLIGSNAKIDFLGSPSNLISLKNINFYPKLVKDLSNIKDLVFLGEQHYLSITPEGVIEIFKCQPHNRDSMFNIYC